MTAVPITTHDPGFSGDAFVSYAQAVFLRVIQARATGRLDEVQRLTAPGFFAELQAEGPRPRLQGTAAVSASLVSAGTQGAWDTAGATLTAAAWRPQLPAPAGTSDGTPLDFTATVTCRSL